MEFIEHVEKLRHHEMMNGPDAIVELTPLERPPRSEDEGEKSEVVGVCGTHKERIMPKP